MEEVQALNLVETPLVLLILSPSSPRPLRPLPSSRYSKAFPRIRSYISATDTDGWQDHLAVQLCFYLFTSHYSMIPSYSSIGSARLQVLLATPKPYNNQLRAVLDDNGHR